MTGDPLDRITPALDEAERLGRRQSAKLLKLIREARTEHEALVEVARAARDVSERCTPKDPALKDLRAALARLDGPR